jgi:hypothetical protein
MVHLVLTIFMSVLCDVVYKVLQLFRTRKLELFNYVGVCTYCFKSISCVYFSISVSSWCIQWSRLPGANLHSTFVNTLH